MQSFLPIPETMRELEERAIAAIQEHEPTEGYYLAFSGGKDSQVVYDLVKKAGVKYDVHFHFTTVDPPELLQFLKKNYPEVPWDRPKHSMFYYIERKGFLPTRRIRYCCSLLKECYGKGRVVVTGVRREESHKRSDRAIYEPHTKDKKTIFLNPIVDWKDETVWNYIRLHRIEPCSLYSEGFERIGCVMCPLAGWKQMEKEAKRWPKYYAAYKRAIARGLERAKERGRTSMVSGLTADATMRWWIYAESTPCAEQCQLFG